jgi:hypothetical protein
VTAWRKFIVAGADVKMLEVEILLGHRRHLRIDLLDRLGDRSLQLVVLDDDSLDAQSGRKLDLIDGVQIGWIGNSEEQPLAAPEQGQHAMLEQQLVADQLDRFEVGLD